MIYPSIVDKASTFATSLTDIGKLMTKDTFVALQMPLEVHLQIFAITK